MRRLPPHRYRRVSAHPVPSLFLLLRAQTNGIRVSFLVNRKPCAPSIEARILKPPAARPFLGGTMIIKKKDSLRLRKLELEILLNSFALPPNKRFLVEQEYKRVLSVERGEKGAAYYIDNDFGDSKNVAVLHDLRIEHNGQVAQIDHLLINRMMEIFVLETKVYGNKIEITEDGAFIAHYGKKRFAVPSPIEQNRRHIAVLEKLLYDENLLPTRMGVRLAPKFINLVLVHPNTIIMRPKKFDASRVIPADQLMRWYQKHQESAGFLEVFKDVSKLISSETLESFAKALARHHVPNDRFNYKDYFGITDADLKRKAQSQPDKGDARAKPKAARASKRYFCAGCGKTITRKEAEFCFDRKARFGGRAYCRSCQKNFPAARS
ncbi:MAG: NERD domain-containing protein [Zetaproteobacteria bacterium]|nr:MAG: NERD domain-containing protein [Zetaproteobacteria bacterium]